MSALDIQDEWNIGIYQYRNMLNKQWLKVFHHNTTFGYFDSSVDAEYSLIKERFSILKMIYDLLNPQMEGKYINYIEIAYIKEARFEETIKIGYNKIADNKYEFIGYVNNEKCFEAIIGVKDNE